MILKLLCGRLVIKSATKEYNLSIYYEVDDDVDKTKVNKAFQKLIKTKQKQLNFKIMKKNKSLLLIFFLFISVFAVSQTKENEKKEYYENGKLEYLGKSINGVKTGEWKYYFENGQLKEIGNFENDDATGIWKSYYETGKLKSIGKYIEGNEAGEWKFYDENGKLVETIKYFDGKQSDNIPPIQKYLDKVVNIDQYTSPTKVSQKITVNTFISTLKSKDISWKEVYSNIKWDELYRYEFNEYKDFIVIEFIFYETLNLEIIDEEFGKENKKVESFICKIWPKDKTEVLEILKDWYDKRGY